MNEQMLQRFDAKNKFDLIAGVRKQGKPIFVVGEGLLPKEAYTKQGATFDETVRAFWQHGGFSNQLGLLKLVLARAGIKGLTIPKPQPSLDFGYYYRTDRTASSSPRGTSSSRGSRRTGGAFVGLGLSAPPAWRA